MSCETVAQKLVDFCKAGQFNEAADALYSDNIVSIEAIGDETMPAETRGIEAVRKKGEWWFANHEAHRCDVRGPFPNGDQFAVHFALELTPKYGPNEGKRIQMEEVGIYTVKDNKIVEERFFYDDYTQ